MKYILIVLMMFLTSACVSTDKGKSTSQDNKPTPERKLAGTIPQDIDRVKPGEFVIITSNDYEPLYLEMSRYCDSEKSFTKIYDTAGGGIAVICVKK